MSLADDMATLLVSQGVGTAVGTDVFVGQSPDQDGVPDETWALIETGAIEMNPKWKRDELTFQVLVRGPQRDYTTGYNNAKAAMDAFLGIANQTVSGTDYLQWNAIGGINALGADSRDRSRFSLNFRCVRENVSGGARLPY